MEILIKVYLYYFKTYCGKEASETTERKNFYLYSNCITFFLTPQHKTVIFIILINMKKQIKIHVLDIFKQNQLEIVSVFLI